MPAGVNQDLEELEHYHEGSVQNESLFEDSEFPSDLVAEGELLELQSMKQFDVFEEVERTSLTQSQLKSAIPTRWVRTWKGYTVKCRLFAKYLKCKDFVRDKDDLYASTPTFVVVKMLTVLARSFGWGIWCADVATAFLHAPLSGDPAFVLPPPGHHRALMWRLKKAMYGLSRLAYIGLLTKSV